MASRTSQHVPGANASRMDPTVSFARPRIPTEHGFSARTSFAALSELCLARTRHEVIRLDQTCLALTRHCVILAAVLLASSPI